MVSPALKRLKRELPLYPDNDLSILTSNASTESRIASGLSVTPFRLSLTVYVPPWAYPENVMYLSPGAQEIKSRKKSMNAADFLLHIIH